MDVAFSPETLRFLKGLVRHNDRAWFEERRPLYLRAVREPLHSAIRYLNEHLAAIAPDYVRPPHKVAMRIYRDIRFSPDKRPYKRHISAWWTRAGLEKRSAAGFYLQIGPLESFLAAGVYAPEREDLLSLRRWFAEHHESYRSVLQPLLRPTRKDGAFNPIPANALARMPKGFLPDDPAGEFLRARNWGVLRSFAFEDVLEPSFLARTAERMRRAMPLVSTLNEAFSPTNPDAAVSRRETLW